MRPRRLWAVARKEFLHVWRDPRSLGMGIAMPMIMLLLFGGALTLDVDRVPLVVWDQSQTSASRQFIAGFAGSHYFALQAAVRNYQEMEQAIDSGQALVALVVPRNFAADVGAGRRATAQLIVDGSDPNTATIAVGYAEAVAQKYSEQIGLAAWQRQGGSEWVAPLDLRPRVWFNVDLESRNHLIPALMAVIMMVIAALLTSLTVAREWERGTMEQLIATPVKAEELVVGKLAPYFVIGMLDMVLAVLMGEYLFHVPLRGSLWLIFVVAAVFLIGTLSMGMLISIVTKNQMLANQLAVVLTFVPAYLLSGLMFPISNMPAPLQAATHLIPARYLVTLLRAIYLKGVGLEVLWGQALLLLGFAVMMLALARVCLRKKFL